MSQSWAGTPDSSIPLVPLDGIIRDCGNDGDASILEFMECHVIDSVECGEVTTTVISLR